MVNGEARSMEFRDLTKGSATAGGNTVPEGFYSTLMQHMIDNSAIRRTNVTVLTTDSGTDLPVPKTTTHPVAGIISEAGSITESDAVFGQVTLGAFKYGFSTQLSSELEQDTGVDLVGYLAAIGGQALANGSGAHFVSGDGSSKPNGIVTASTLGVTGATSVSGAFTDDNLIDLYFSVIEPYRNIGTWLMADAAMASARKLKDANDQYVWAPGLSAGDQSTLFGRPVVTDTNVADPAVDAKSVCFGDFSKYVIRDVSGVRVERSVDFAFQNDLITYRFILRTDGDLVDTTGAVKHFVGGAS
jgi:HK97 family phage major capsid protein